MKQIIEIEVPEGKKAVWKEGKVVFEDLEPKLPKTWEEFCKNNPVSDKEACIEYDGNINTIQHSCLRASMVDKNTLPSYEAAEQHLALMQLHQLRDCYRQGWIPDYTDTFTKFSIARHFEFYSYKYYYGIITNITIPRFLSFQSKEIAKEFLNNFRNLIEQAGDLI